MLFRNTSDLTKVSSKSNVFACCPLKILYLLTMFPDPNNIFGGQTAFPESNTIITDLKARKKYKNMQAKPPIHDWLKLANWPYPPPKQ